MPWLLVSSIFIDKHLEVLIIFIFSYRIGSAGRHAHWLWHSQLFSRTTTMGLASQPRCDLLGHHFVVCRRNIGPDYG
jgi:hypothetical protein